MIRMIKWMAPAIAALGLMLCVSAAKAADAGTVTGTVVDKDGKPVEGATVRVMKPMAGGPGAPGGGGGRRGAQGQADAPAQPNRPRGPESVGEAKTDKDGKFSIANVPAGDYQVVAVNADRSGFAREKVTVKAGESATVALKLGDRPQRGPGGGAGGGGGGAGGGAGGGRRGGARGGN